MHSDYIPTKKKRTRYQFISPKKEDPYKPIYDDNIYVFYQMCTFLNPKTKTYNVRRFIINSKNEFVNMKEYNITKKQYKKFIMTTKKHKYKCYSTYSLKYIDYPNMGDILTAKSNILSKNYDYTGFSPF